MKSLKVVVAGLLLVSCTAMAQTPAEKEQKAAVKELLDAMNFKQIMSQMAGVMAQQMPQMLDQMIDGMAGGGKLTDEQKAEARRLARDAQSSSSRQLVEMYNDPQFVQAFEDIMARAYARHFTLDEIRATSAFYTSSAGRKALSVMPKMMQETMPEVMAMMAPRMNAMAEKVAKDLVAQVEKGKAKGEAAAR